jgi:hypothetical protein
VKRCLPLQHYSANTSPQRVRKNWVQKKEIAMAAGKGVGKHGIKRAVAGPIRVTLPVSVACDLDKFQRALANVAAMVGSAGCASGIGIALQQTREFVIDPASLQVREAVGER